MGFHNQAIADLFEGAGLAVACKEPPSPGLCEGIHGRPRLRVTTLVALPQGGGVKETRLPMPGARVMDASVSC